jgi:hypothetical protein
MRPYGWDPNPVELVSLLEEKGMPEAHMHRGMATWGHSKKVAICKPREASGETEHGKNLIWDLQPPEL